MRAHIFALFLAYAVASATAQDLTTNIKVRGNVLSLLGCRCSISMSFTIDVLRARDHGRSSTLKISSFGNLYIVSTTSDRLPQEVTLLPNRLGSPVWSCASALSRYCYDEICL
jgi:hypothetical protein